MESSELNQNRGESLRRDTDEFNNKDKKEILQERLSATKEENRNVSVDQNSPEILTNSIYTPAFLREQIGKLMRVEFLIGTNNLVDRIGILQDVGASYILLRSFENDSLVYCDIYSIKFITISTTGLYGNSNGMNMMNWVNDMNGINNINGMGGMNGINNMPGISSMTGINGMNNSMAGINGMNNNMNGINGMNNMSGLNGMGWTSA